MDRILSWLKKELYELAPVWIFFFFFVLLLRITEWAILQELGIREGIIKKVLIFTFLIAKVFVVLDNLNFMNRFVNRPLIYSIVWKTLFYTLGIFLARLIEFLFSQSITQIFEGMLRPRFWIIQIWTITLLFIFCSTRELIKKIGKDNFLKMVFSAP
jgi:hypothetical protein